MTTPKTRKPKTPEQRERDRASARARYELNYRSTGAHKQTKSGVPEPSLLKKGVSQEADLEKLRAHPAAKNESTKRFGD